MRLPFNGTYPLTQGFGNKLILNGKDVYAQYGLQGHNGHDYGTPTGTAILAPHSGKVLEVADEGKIGYGKYIKIENDKEGSVLAHLKEQLVKVGETVSEGQLIAFSDNTGNSTGAHLHWGYYRLPRNRSNGYAGFIDQQPFLTGSSEMLPVEKATFENLVAKATKYDQFHASGFTTVEEVMSKVKSLEKVVSDKDAEIKKLTEDNKLLAQRVSDALQLAEKANEEDLQVHQASLEQQHKIDELTQFKNTVLMSLDLPYDAQNKAVFEAISKIKEPTDKIVSHYEKVLDQMWVNVNKNRDGIKKTFIKLLVLIWHRGKQ